MGFNILFKQIIWMITKVQDLVLMSCFENVWGQLKRCKCKTFLAPGQAYPGAQLEEAALNGTWTISRASLKIDLYWSDTILHAFLLSTKEKLLFLQYAMDTFVKIACFNTGKECSFKRFHY